MTKRYDVELSQPLTVPRASMWRAWTEPVELARWQADEVETKDDRHYTLTWPALGGRLDVEVLIAEPGRRLVLKSGRFELEVALSDRALRFEHRGAASSDEADGIRSAWRVSLAQLGHYLEHHSGRPRSVVWLSRAAPVSAATAHVFYTDRAALGTWLGRGAIGPTGLRYAIELAAGETISGRVLANTDGRDVALSWEEQDNSLLVLRTLPADDDELSLVVNWSRWGRMNDSSHHQQLLEAALNRLVDRLTRQTFA